MRWLVEVTSLGKSDKESLSVEAESWQKALQSARGQRGESAPMSGFSIELLDDGCRAVDPMSRLRYEVRRAPDEGPGTRSVPPRPASHPPSPAAKKPAPAAARTAMSGSSSVEAAPAIAPAAAPAPPPPAPHVAAPAAAAPQRPDVAVSVPSQIIFKREQDATDALPLTYREYVYVVPPGTTEAVAETLLLTQLEMVRSSLERVPSAKLVNLGVFDVAFQGKPPVPPLATLAWKDWRGAPVVSFPRRSKPSSQPQPASFVAVPPVQIVPAPFAAPAPQPAPVAAPPAAPVPVAPAPVMPIAPAPVMNVAPAPVVNVANVAPPPVAAAPPPPPQMPAPVAAQAFAPPAPPVSTRTPPTGVPRARVRGEDLIADLFEAMHDLHFVRDALEGGEFCLALAMEKLPCQAGIVHLYEIDRREFVVTCVRGAGTSKLLLRRHPENDALLLAAMRKRRALVVADGTQAEGATADRYTMLGGAHSLLIAPVLLHGRFLGALELMNPLDGQPFNESEGNALTYIAEQFAEFISSHGIVTDPERVSQRPPPRE